MHGDYSNIEVAPQGGETSIVDGFYVADKFRKMHPEEYKLLSTLAIPSEYIGDEQHHYTVDTIFKVFELYMLLAAYSQWKPALNESYFSCPVPTDWYRYQKSGTGTGV